MRAHITMKPDNEFLVEAWQATKPEAVLAILRKQLAAAKAVWPELDRVEIKGSLPRTRP